MIDDPHLWLEDVGGAEALDWVRGRNERTFEAFTLNDKFRAREAEILALLDTDDRIPGVSMRNGLLYNFWVDANNPRGLWRRTTMESYRREDIEWDVLLDVDALAAAEDENWVFKGVGVCRDGDDRALISLSRGGADATVVREFDLVSRSFVPGFEVAEAKTSVGWIDRDSVYIGTDFGPGSLTDSGYPRIVKRWQRGTALSDAVTIFEGESSDVSVGAGYDPTPDWERHSVSRSIDFYNSLTYLLDGDQLVLIDVPTDAGLDWYHDWLFIRPKTEWTVGEVTFPAGSFLVSSLSGYLAGERDLRALFTPDAHTSFAGASGTANYLIFATMTDVKTKLWLVDPNNDWAFTALLGNDDIMSAGVASTDALSGSDEFLLSTSSFTQPPTLLTGSLTGEHSVLKQSPAFFDADSMTTEQFFATSDDGTQVPYFVTRKQGATGPTILGGYGGFEVSNAPAYLALRGNQWLTAGGISVVANIRGGGEYGPDWHNQAIKQHRHRAFEDFAAVAKDLVARGITTPAQLSAIGGSNGGLLMGVMLTRYPELFGAIVCQVPLLDMKRYHLLLAGASWMAEYGDPDSDDWEFIKQYSPYQNTDPKRTYPPILVTTSTRDDRVHPGHARKMVARLAEQGHEVWYYENIEGGHGGAADNKQAAFNAALVYEFLTAKLC